MQGNETTATKKEERAKRPLEERTLRVSILFIIILNQALLWGFFECKRVVKALMLQVWCQDGFLLHVFAHT